LDKEIMPKHVAIIMDGNGRWAKKRGMPRTFGHRAGMDALRRAVRGSAELGIEWLTVYAFSTENWRRPPEETNFLFSLLEEYLYREIEELKREKVRIRFIGTDKGLPKKLVVLMRDIEKSTTLNEGLTLNIAFNYGGREEIVAACQLIAQKCAAGELEVDSIDETCFSQHCYAPDIPDPELIIRTSGEVRISNFLLWQVAYAEFVVLDVLWPDFTKEHLQQGIDIFQKRSRRFGGI
jgi:undecaprenyl diphosphate synthase